MNKQEVRNKLALMYRGDSIKFDEANIDVYFNLDGIFFVDLPNEYGGISEIETTSLKEVLEFLELYEVFD